MKKYLPLVRAVLTVCALLVLLVMGYLTFSYGLYTGVWGHDEEGRDPLKVMMCTERAHDRHYSAFVRAMTGARKLDKYFVEPSLRQTGRFFDLSYYRWQKSPYAQLDKSTNEIIADTVWTRGMSDKELECLYGHEFGHVIWHQVYDDPDEMKVRGVYGVSLTITEQWYADDVGRAICGKEEFDRFLTRYVPDRMPETITVIAPQAPAS